MSMQDDGHVALKLASVQNGRLENGDVEENGNQDIFAVDSFEMEPRKEGRIIRKAKRLTKMSPRKEEAVNGELSPSQLGITSGQGPPRPVFTKNSRKSRSAFGRGMPKKGGAGGKGTWGLPGAEIYESSECSDMHDPNYDSDSQDTVVMRPVEPDLSDEELSKAIEPILREYLEHGDTKEALLLLDTVHMGNNKQRVLEFAIGLAMERHDPQRELTSRLIADLHGSLLSPDDVALGFENLLKNLSDLSLDTPDASMVLGQFLARALADECLPSDYITRHRGAVDSEHVKNALEKADILVSLNHGLHKLDTVWGVGGGNRPVRYLTKKMVLLLKEYLSSGELSEAARCLKELDVPHFHHELVYQSAVISIEESTDRAADMMVQLLKALTASNIITPNQLKKGVKRVFDDMPEICVDVPAAYALLERLGNKLYTESVLPDSLYKELPVRGRKRFVSEGDGGKVKSVDALM